MKASIEVADILRIFGPAYRQQHGADLSMEQRRAMRAIEAEFDRTTRRALDERKALAG